MDLQLMTQYKQCLDRARLWSLKSITVEGNLEGNIDDLLAYYALPYLYANLGLKEESYRMINYLLHSFSTQDGGLRRKLSDSTHQPLAEQLPKIMSWIAIAAHAIGRFDVSYTYSKYLRRYYDPDQGAFTTIAPCGSIDAVLDLFSSTMLGWFALCTGDMKKAQRAGNFLQRCISLQSTKDQTFYLRLEQDGRMITSFPSEQASFYMVTAQNTDHNVHYLSTPVIFLAKLYQATHEQSYLRTAQSYFETAYQYHPAIEPNMAWGAAILANITKEARYINKAKKGAEQIVSTQDEAGHWPSQDRSAHHYNTAIRAIALSEVLMELSTT